MNTNVLVHDDAKLRLFGSNEPTLLLRDLVKLKLLGDSPDLDAPRAGLMIGHYQIVGILGQGGMGIVYAAYDQRLERRVAIKLLRVVDHEGRIRLVREARALARLSHPNVVHVHEVGEWSGHDYVVMELVDGITLRDWIDRRDGVPDWRTGLELMIQAGRGLAAAHAVELVHRDFKPANVMVGNDGRARVLDFGLARWAVGVANSVAELQVSQPITLSGSFESLESSIEECRAGEDTTRSGFVGTLDYMAPEQRLGLSATPRSDQYTFCVVLCEALGGERPPSHGGSRCEGGPKSTKITAPRGAPVWLRRAIQRGLARDPELRWPSMDTLLAELTQPRRAHRRMMLAGGAVGLGVTVASMSLWPTPESEDRCSLDPRRWDSSHRDEFRRVWTDEGLDADVATIVEDRLELQQAAILVARAELCEASPITQLTRGFELRSACVDQRERELGAVVDTLVDARNEHGARALDLLGTLGEVDVCDRPELIQGWALPKDGRVADEVEALRDELVKVELLRLEGRLAEAWRLLGSVEQRASRARHAPLEAEILLARGKLQTTSEDERAAWATLRDAAILAERCGHLELAAVAWTHAVGVGTDPQLERSTEYLMAVAALERVATPDDARWRELELRLAYRLYVGNRLVDALARTEPVEPEPTKDSLARLHRVRVLRLRGRILHDLGRRDEAISTYRLANERCEALLSANLLECANLSFDLGVVLIERSTSEAEGIAQIERARAIFADTFEPGSSRLVMGDLAVANHALMIGNLTTARRYVDHALASTPPSHPDRSYALDVAALVALAEPDRGAADSAFTLAIDQHLAEGRENDVRLAFVYFQRSALRRLEGRDDDEISDLGRALAIHAKAVDGGGLDQARAHVALGQALQQRDPIAAITSFERAGTILDMAPDDEIRRDQMLGWAEAMVELGDGAGAVRLACAALVSHERLDVEAPAPARLLEMTGDRAACPRADPIDKSPRRGPG